MGRIERVNFDVVRPTEYFPSFADISRVIGNDISDSTIRYILWHHIHDKVEFLGPSVGRLDVFDQGEVHVIDGHHKLIVADLLGASSSEFYIPDSDSDRITKEEEPLLHPDALEAMNRNISYRFRRVHVNVEAAAKDGIRTIRDLRMQYPQLRTQEAAAIHYRIDDLGRESMPAFVERPGGVYVGD